MAEAVAEVKSSLAPRLRHCLVVDCGRDRVLALALGPAGNQRHAALLRKLSRACRNSDLRMPAFDAHAGLAIVSDLNFIGTAPRQARVVADRGEPKSSPASVSSPS